jgi:hypothetical protein
MPIAGLNIVERTIAANGIRLHLVKTGEGEPVLLLHGFREFWYSWRHQLQALPNFGFRTIAADLRGYNGLVVLNFSQPQGTRVDGIIQSVQNGKLLHVDLEDCTLMGYKVFGVVVEKETAKDIQYTTKGDVRAYVQFQQEIPPGMERLATWPVNTFQSIAPPSLK